MYYRSCPVCGCALDPGERCECLLEEEKRVNPEAREAGAQRRPEASEEVRKPLVYKQGAR